MGQLSISTVLNGAYSATLPIDKNQIEVNLTFGAMSGQPRAEIDRLTFVNKDATYIKNWPSKFAGIPCVVTISDGTLGEVILDGFLDLTDNYEEIEPQFKGGDHPVIVVAKFVDLSTINGFNNQIKGLTFSALRDAGAFPNYEKAQVLIQKRLATGDLLTLVTSISVIENLILASIDRVKRAIAHIAGLAGTGIGLIASIALAVVLAALELAIALATILSLIALSITTIRLAGGDVVENKCKYLIDLLRGGVERLGYELDSNVDDLGKIAHIPALTGSEGKRLIKSLFPIPPSTSQGVPDPSDPLHFFADFLNAITEAFRLRIDIIGDVILVKNENDPYWELNSEYTLPDVFFQSRKFNSKELSQTYALSFITDTLDKWTLENYRGTAYERKTSTSANVTDKTNSIAGLTNKIIPVALATRKTELLLLEKILQALLDLVVGFASALKLKKKAEKLKGLFRRRIGMILVTDDGYSKPKWVVLNSNGTIPSNHRSILSAKALYEKYHTGTSFVDSENNAQRDIYKDLEIPNFSLSDFDKVKKTKNTSTFNGGKAQFTSAKWLPFEGKLIADIEVKPAIIDNTLTENFIEVNND